MAGGGSKDGKGGAEAARAAPKKKRGWRCAERPAREREGLLACSRHAVNDPVPLELAAGSKIGPGVEGVDRGIRPCARSCRDPYLQTKGKQSGICGRPARAKCANFFYADVIHVWWRQVSTGSCARSAGARLGGATDRGVLDP